MLRGDNDAVSVKWEVISEEEDKKVHIKEEPLCPDESQDTSANNTQNTLGLQNLLILIMLFPCNRAYEINEHNCFLVVLKRNRIM